METIGELIAIGDGVPETIELGYHLCYGSPADEHVIQPKDAGVMVEMVNAVCAGVRRSIDFFHLPVPKPRTDDAFFAPLDGLNLRPDTELYLGLVHRDDMAGNAARLAGARRHARVDGVDMASTFSSTFLTEMVMSFFTPTAPRSTWSSAATDSNRETAAFVAD